MAVVTKITITHDKEVNADVQTLLKLPSYKQNEEINIIQNYFNAVAGGVRNASIDLQVDDGDAVAASGTLTLASVVATDTCAINGVTFTAIASGATGNQFNVGLTDTLTAVNLKTAINASVTALVSGYVTATSSGAVVTVSASNKGTYGNTFTLVGSADITANVSRLAGGTNATANVYAFGL